MDTYLKNYLYLNIQGDLIEEVFGFTNAKSKVMTQTKVEESTKVYSLRGLGRYKPENLKQKSTEELDALRLSNPGPIRGLGRKGSFYIALNSLFKTRKKESTKSYTYWRGAGRPC
jgi:hypothetical protein